jgi:ABC-type amino acid transport system permease subunit
MYFLQEAIAAAPFLVIAFIVAIVMIIVTGYVLYTWARRKKYGDEAPPGRIGPVTFIVMVVLVILLLAGCGWLCGIKYD